MPHAVLHVDDVECAFKQRRAETFEGVNLKPKRISHGRYSLSNTLESVDPRTATVAFRHTVANGV